MHPAEEREDRPDPLKGSGLILPAKLAVHIAPDPPEGDVTEKGVPTLRRYKRHSPAPRVPHGHDSAREPRRSRAKLKLRNRLVLGSLRLIGKAIRKRADNKIHPLFAKMSYFQSGHGKSLGL